MFDDGVGQVRGRGRRHPRGALATQLGSAPKFKPVAHDGFGAPTAGGGAPAAGASPDDASDPVGEPPPDDEPPPSSLTADDDDDYVSPDEMNAAPVADVAVDSVGLFTRAFDATVVEEVTRD